ncbi:MAG: EAL domain-containing protein, partial [Desulfitobacterium hafniense]|nr:EAL domain-containing protein [Desulfitobacterium hafniense]
EEFFLMHPPNIFTDEIRKKTPFILRQLIKNKMTTFEADFLSKEGHPIPVEINCHMFNLNENNVFLAIARDIAERKKYEEELKSSEAKFRSVFQDAGIPMALVDLSYPEPRIVESNLALQKLLNYKEEELKGMLTLSITHPEDIGKTVDLYNKAINVAIADTQTEKRFLRKDGQAVWVNVTSSTIEGISQGKFGLGMAEDITARKQMEEELKYLATHDFLTGVLNRYSFDERLSKVIKKGKQGVESALLLIDIDNFKLVNDYKGGHETGDEALKMIAGILQSSIREEDLLARYGGDEFAVLLEEVSLDDALEIAERIRTGVDEQVLYLSKNNSYYNFSVSIGIAKINGAIEKERLVSLADNALYSAKEKGKNRICFSIEDSTYRYTEENRLIISIKKALKQKRFTVLYQPVVSISTGETSHFEALSRIINDDKEIILPGIFIPVAERNSLMPDIERCVIEHVLNVLKLNPNITVFANISGLSLSDEPLLNFIEGSIKKSKIQPERLGFEITETSMIRDLDHTKNWIHRIKQMGCKFALDDFGVGFSSFSYLKELPVDYLKIDGSFIQKLDSDPSNIALVQAMNAVANTLGKKTIAEFVENKNVLKILKELNIEYGQGYFFGKPSILSSFLQNNKI